MVSGVLIIDQHLKEVVMAKKYQCFSTKDNEVYCSSYMISNHTEGAIWVSETMAHFDLVEADILGKTYLTDFEPRGAILYPAVSGAVAHEYRQVTM